MHKIGPENIVATYNFPFHGLQIAWVAFETPCGRFGLYEGGKDGLDEIVGGPYETPDQVVAAVKFLEAGIVYDLALMN